MSILKKIILILLAAALAVLAALTWGSIGSIVCVFGLLMIPGICLWQKFLNGDRDSDFFEDQNG